ncbi:MAG: M42 family peptidase [Phycisphaera sp.]|nr:M42 family peptidase [Phycisphaera sp.]
MNSELLTRIGNTPGIPGYEHEIQDFIFNELIETCDEVRRDAMNNVIGLRKPTKPLKSDKPVRLMFAAHCDEIGMMVKHIEGSGLIRFHKVGGIYTPAALSQRVVIHGREKVRGVMVPNFAEPDKMPNITDILIDTGLSKDELEKIVNVGDPITYDSDTAVLNGKTWVGRNFDNRLGSYCLVQAMREFKSTSCEVYAVSTVQEEVGLRGARPAAFGVAPDIGIAIDGSMSRGAYVPDHGNLCVPGKGTGIYMIDNLTIAQPRLLDYMFNLCEKRGIAYQRNIGGGTDAAAMQQSRSGVIATTIGAPTRYMHSTVQLAHADDIDATVALLVAMMETAHEFHAQVAKSFTPVQGKAGKGRKAR